MSRLMRSNLVVASGTAVSRLTGLGRVFALGYVIGQTPVADAYTLANETPNIVYDLLIGGVLSATLVPLFTSLSDSSPDSDPVENRRATNVVITTALAGIALLTVVAVVAAPVIFRLYSLQPSAAVDADTFRSAGTALTRIFLVQILFYGLTGVANGYLNSRRRFLAAAWSPAVSNLVIIATLLSIPQAGSATWALGDVLTDTRFRLTLGWGTTLSVAAMAAIVVPAMVRAGLNYRFEWNLRHPAVRKLIALSGWTIGFVVANQVALIVVRNLALGQGPGVAKAYFDAFVFFVLPHGLLAVSIATTFQPELAHAVTTGDQTRFVRFASMGTRMIALLTLPAAVGMITLARPIIGLLKRGQFDLDAVDRTAPILVALAIGLVGFSVYLFVLRGFYAHQDTRTPFILNVGENLLNIVLGLILIQVWGVFGLALSYSIAYLVAAVAALAAMHAKVPDFTLRPVLVPMIPMVVAAVVMAAAIWAIVQRFDSHVGWSGIAEIAIGGSVGVAVYLVALWVLRVPELRAVRRGLT
ncbi:MAG: murein biosynthesis integral membrane protein MurJ [Ilumatobacter coccineus]|uniref:Murein biosynthesis integral membrane protein MurJ n=1 Tax=Ilumatobacter coccineus TaxID=467094 RepID=A0A2G6K968_9ACTN|nr:MAG: murein biosynthesis integral membrane protein MurJ [Ilumatobacter coccineus]